MLMGGKGRKVTLATAAGDGGTRTVDDRSDTNDPSKTLISIQTIPAAKHQRRSLYFSLSMTVAGWQQKQHCAHQVARLSNIH